MGLNTSPNCGMTLSLHSTIKDSSLIGLLHKWINCSNVVIYAVTLLGFRSPALPIGMQGIYSQVLYVVTSGEVCECLDTWIDMRYDCGEDSL